MGEHTWIHPLGLHLQPPEVAIPFPHQSVMGVGGRCSWRAHSGSHLVALGKAATPHLSSWKWRCVWLEEAACLTRVLAGVRRMGS